MVSVRKEDLGVRGKSSFVGAQNRPVGGRGKEIDTQRWEGCRRRLPGIYRATRVLYILLLIMRLYGGEK
jgi:hypothetical protein